MATRRASPELASQAEKVRRIIGDSDHVAEFIIIDHKAIEINSDNIIPSKQIKADKKCERLKVNPARLRENVEVIMK